MGCRQCGVEIAEDTLQKALRINLEPRWYGTVAEIGAGQEVARWFFRAGGAAGSDRQDDVGVRHGGQRRGVRQVRPLRVQRAGCRRCSSTSWTSTSTGYRIPAATPPPSSPSPTRSSRAATAAATSATAGWGCASRPGPATSRARSCCTSGCSTTTPSLQQEALGIVGVNLMHAAFFEHHEPDQMVSSLLDRLSTGRIEIDMIEFRGIEFRRVDNRLMALKLVQLGLSGVAMFGPDGQVLQPSEALRKHAVLVERGSFRPADGRQHRHAGVRAEKAFEKRPGRPGPAGPRPHRAHHAQPAGRRARRSTAATSWPARTCCPPAA